MVSSNDEPEESNSDHCINHGNVTEYTFISHFRNYVADNPEARKDKDVDFGVTKKPENVLVQDWITSTSRREERSSEVTIAQQHRDATCQDWQREQQQICCNDHRSRIKSNALHTCPT
jgi:hypothetical protein